MRTSVHIKNVTLLRRNSRQACLQSRAAPPLSPQISQTCSVRLISRLASVRATSTGRTQTWPNPTWSGRVLPVTGSPRNNHSGGITPTTVVRGVWRRPGSKSRNPKSSRSKTRLLLRIEGWLETLLARLREVPFSRIKRPTDCKERKNLDLLRRSTMGRVPACLWIFLISCSALRSRTRHKRKLSSKRNSNGCTTNPRNQVRTPNWLRRQMAWASGYIKLPQANSFRTQAKTNYRQSQDPREPAPKSTPPPPSISKQNADWSASLRKNTKKPYKSATRPPWPCKRRNSTQTLRNAAATKCTVIWLSVRMNWTTS